MKTITNIFFGIIQFIMFILNSIVGIINFILSLILAFMVGRKLNKKDK